MTEKRQKSVTILAIILGLLTLSFIVVASSGLVYMTLVTPEPEQEVITVNSTVVIQLGGTSINWGPGTPSPTLNPTQKAVKATNRAKPIPLLHGPDFLTPEPVYIKTVKQLGGMDTWGETLGVILVLMLISSLMLFTRVGKQKG